MRAYLPQLSLLLALTSCDLLETRVESASSDLVVRAERSHDADSIAFIQMGRPVRVDSCAAGWCRVRVWFKAGYAPDSLLVPVERLSRTCCKTCRTGQACGNSCISRNKTCRQPPGCACDR